MANRSSLTRRDFIALCGSVLAVLLTLAGVSFAALRGDEKKVRVVLAGDSRVTDKVGWGKGFEASLKPGAECINLSAGGRSSKSFINEGHWKKCLALKPDYVLIQFGHVVKEIAAAKHVPLLDLHTRSIELYEKLGKEGCNALSPRTDKGIDNTHLNAQGSQVIGQLVAAELKKAVPELAPWIERTPGALARERRR